MFHVLGLSLLLMIVSMLNRCCDLKIVLLIRKIFVYILKFIEIMPCAYTVYVFCISFITCSNFENNENEFSHGFQSEYSGFRCDSKS